MPDVLSLKITSKSLRVKRREVQLFKDYDLVRQTKIQNKLFKLQADRRTDGVRLLKTYNLIFTLIHSF